MNKYRVATTSGYRKSYKRIVKRGFNLEKLEAVVYQLSNGEKLAPKYKDHVLKGKYKDYHECHIEPDWLLIYKIQDDVLILTLIDTGSHSDLFHT